MAGTIVIAATTPTALRIAGGARVWNKLPVAVTQALELALKEPQLSPRELAVSFVDRQEYFVSEASVYRLLKAHDLITIPAFILMKAADTFATPTTAPNQLWQTDLLTCG
jgi:putative transposase